MNDIEKYITQNVGSWAKKYPDIESVRYAYDKISGFHIVEVSPETVRTDNEDFASEELNLWMNFMECYPDAELLISGPSDVNDMSNIIYESAPVLSRKNIIADNCDYNCINYNDTYSFDMSNYSIAA